MKQGTILKKKALSNNSFEFLVYAPDIALSAKAGQFVLLIVDEFGERIPLTIADSDPKNKTITLVMIVVGTSTYKLSKLKESDTLYALVGPLGNPSKLIPSKSVVFIGGGLGIAPIYPIAKFYRENLKETKITTILGAKNESLLFWQDKLSTVSDRLLIATDDGSCGVKGFVTTVLKDLLEKEAIDLVYAIGPLPMMKACSNTTLPFKVSTIVSLNSLMVDGTGMCGGCRVIIDGKVKFTCVDGPEFDGHLVDWNRAFLRGRIFNQEERCSYDIIVDKALNKNN